MIWMPFFVMQWSSSDILPLLSWMHKGFGDKHARHSSISGSNICPPSSVVHGSLISLACIQGWLRKTSISSYCGTCSWISSSFMDSWDVDLSMVATLSLEQGFKNILAVVCPLFLDQFLSIFGFFLLVQSSCYNTHQNMGGLMHIKIMDAWNLFLNFS